MEKWKAIGVIGVSALLVGAGMGADYYNDKRYSNAVDAQIDALENEASAMEDLLDAKDGEIADLSKMLEDGKLKIISMEIANAELKADVEAKIAEMAELAGDMDALKELLAEKDMTLADYKKALEEEMGNPFDKLIENAKKEVLADESLWDDYEDERWDEDEVKFKWDDDESTLRLLNYEDGKYKVLLEGDIRYERDAEDEDDDDLYYNRKNVEFEVEYDDWDFDDVKIIDE